ncbi:tyrosine--tRNA ligase [Candidatus Wolfebacteria bacterium]|nr:tyrosine--tRNA ligase [Candidatus Wolfebacteria bacterium]
MKIDTDSKKIDDILTRGVEEIIEKESFVRKLKSGKQMRIKFGIDPTGPVIHLGNAVPFRKLREFQGLGHRIILIIGDFTARIGDPSDKESMRQPLTKIEIKKNMKTYKTQIGKILDLKKTEFAYNGKWLSKLNFQEILGKLANQFTVAQILERENFMARYKTGKPIGLPEFLYPLMQGYDSMIVKADLEIGGTDQKFNMLAGRNIQRAYNQRPQDIMTLTLLSGTDGRKMSKSYGNIIGINDKPNDMYGKIMSIKDELIPQYFELCTLLPLMEAREFRDGLKNKKINPRDAKAKLAYEIVKIYHGEKSAAAAEKEFVKVFKEKEMPAEMPEIKLPEKETNILELLVKTKLTSSKSEAKRLIEQGGVKINGEIQNDWRKIVFAQKGMIIQSGKRKFVKII